LFLAGIPLIGGAVGFTRLVLFGILIFGGIAALVFRLLVFAGVALFTFGVFLVLLPVLTLLALLPVFAILAVLFFLAILPQMIMS